MKDKKAIVWQIWLLIARFQNGSNKVAIERRVVQFWSEIIRVISKSNERAARVRFEITSLHHKFANCTPLSSITIIYNMALSNKD